MREAQKAIVKLPSIYYTTPMQIKSILLLSKTGHPEAGECAAAMGEWLSAKGVSWRLTSPGEEFGWMRDMGRTDAVVVLGGDGTLVGVLRRLVSADVRVPVLAVNFGRVGFLAEVDAQSWQAPLAALVDGSARLASRMAMHWRVVRNGEEVVNGCAVNDVVIGRGTLARVLTLGVTVNGILVGRVRADGLLISTPAGTTGYAASAGGSIVHPDLQTLSVTAIAPFLCRLPPLVMPADSAVCLTHDSPSDAFLTVDGQDGVALVPGDAVCVNGLPDAFALVAMEPAAYFERLRRCGFVADGGDAPEGASSCENCHR